MTVEVDPPKLRLDPWWVRHPTWWEEQRRMLRVLSPGGEFTADPQEHHMRWRGMIAVPGVRASPSRRARRGLEHEVEILWTSGTPWFAPLFRVSPLLSRVHQLQGRWMCLDAPSAESPGWHGVVGIRWWWDRAVEWLHRFQSQGWRVNQAAAWWELVRLGPYYRPPAHHGFIIAVPPALDDLRDAFGTGWVRIPQDRAGLGVVESWRHLGGERNGWDVGTQLVRADKAMHRVPFIWGTTGQEPSEKILHRLILDLEEVKPGGSFFGSLFRAQGVDDEDWQFNMKDWTRYARARGSIAKLYALIEGTEYAPAMALRGATLDRRRRAGRRDTVHARVSAASVVIVGLGSLGSEIAHLLAQEGVREFTLVDGDYMLPGNEARHRAGLDDAGKAKVLAMREHILRRLPDAIVRSVNGWADEVFDDLLRADGERPLIVGATGDEGAEHYLADVAEHLGLPVFHAWLERSGRVLRLSRTVPGRDPTLGQQRESQQIPVLAEPGTAGDIEACGENVLPGAALQIHAAANFVVRQVMRLISDPLDPGAVNHWLFAPDGLSGAHAPPELRHAYGTLALACTRNAVDPGGLHGDD